MTARLIMKLRVEASIETAPGVLHLTFVHPARPDLPQWLPGAHVDIKLPDGRVRQYSLCGNPADSTRYEIAIRREEAGRGGSTWAHANLTPGAIAHVSHPRNNFPLVENARKHVFVAGGIGVTPFLAMAHLLKAKEADYELHFCARSAEEAPLLREARAICGDRLVCWFSSEGRRFDPAALQDPEPDVHAYACGPHRLMDAVQSTLDALGWPADHVHVEHFGAMLDENFQPEPFDAVIASTGRTLHVPADRSLLDVLRADGFRLSSSCELGVCGACECGYSDGTVIHRDVVLPSSKQHDRMLTCVSRARGTVTLAM